MRRILAVLFLLTFVLGCSKCILIRSEYFDITGSVLQPKPDDAEVIIFTDGQEVERSYSEIGAVKVMAPYGTSHEALNREMIRRARSAGADAVVDVAYVEDPQNKLPLCGKLFSTKRNMNATGRAVVFTDKK